MTIPEWIWPLLGTLVSGAVGGGIVALVGASMESKREHARWIRQERYQALFDYLELVDAAWYGKKMKLPHITEVDALRKMQSVASRVGLVGGLRMKEHAEELQEAVASFVLGTEGSGPQFDAARLAYVEATRKVLGITG